MTKQEVCPEVRIRSEAGPPWWANRARVNSHQRWRWFPQIKGQLALLRAFLCLLCCCEKRKNRLTAQEVLSTIFYPIFSISFSLDILPSHPWKALCLPFPLPCGYFHSGIPMLYAPLTQMSGHNHKRQQAAG